MKGKKNKQNNTEIKNSKYKNNATNRKVCRDQYGSVHAWNKKKYAKNLKGDENHNEHKETRRSLPRW